jgi:hypothetical protein
MDCTTCRLSQKDGFVSVECRGIDYVPICPTGKVPKLSQTNQDFLRIFDRILPGLMRGNDGYDYEAIRIVFDLCGISKHRRAIYLDQCLAVMGVIHRIRKNNRDQHG